MELVRKTVTELLSDEVSARQALQYGTTAGSDTLRRELLSHLADLEQTSVSELGISADQIVVTTGSPQFLSLVGEVLLNPGDITLVAAPTYFVYLGTLNGLGTRIIPVATDEDGMRMDALEETLFQLDSVGELSRVKMIYVVDYFDNPSAVSLSLERRSQLVDIARRWSREQRIAILEDAAYRELRYDGPELPSIWSFDHDKQHVILAMTFSKSFSPGLRVGYGVLPADLVGPVCDRKGNEDFGSAHFNQRLLARVLSSGEYTRHVEGLRSAYRLKRDCMLAAAERDFSQLPGVHWVSPRGGLYVWMTLPETVRTDFTSPLFSYATKEEGVMYVPGDFCFAGPPTSRPRNHMRLSFGVQDCSGIEAGMQRLARAVAAQLP